MTTSETGGNASRASWAARNRQLAFQPKRPSSLRPRSCPGKTDGFTLVETLVVLALVSMMTALMAVSIGQVGKIRTVQQQQVSDMVRRDILRVVKSDLKGALSIPLIENDGADQAVFLGKPDEIRFVAYVPIGFRAYGVREVRYAIRTDDNKRLLLVRELRRHMHENRNSNGFQQEEMKLGSGQMARFQFRDNAVQTEFSESWQTRLAFPSAIRIDFAGKTAAGRNPQSNLLYP